MTTNLRYGDKREDGYIFVGWKNYKGIKKPDYVAALFPEKPPDDFIEMFSTSLRYKIYVIWETNKGYFDNNLPEGIL